MTYDKDTLIELFRTGKIPTGEHFEGFINQAYNNYKIVDMFNPNEPPTWFEIGENILVFQYDPAKNPDWLALFGDEVTAGEVMVRTMRYPGAGVTVQEYDTYRDGRYYANFSRVSNDDTTWGELKKHPEVRTVNGIFPNINGNIEIGGSDLPASIILKHTPETTDFDVADVPINDPYFNPSTCALELRYDNGVLINKDYYTVIESQETESGYSISFVVDSLMPTRNLFKYDVVTWRVTGLGGGDGDLVVPKPEVTFDSFYSGAGGITWTYEFDLNIPNYDPETDYLEIHRGGVQNTGKLRPEDFEIASYTDTTIHIKLLDGMRTNDEHPMFAWRYKYSTMPRLDATVIDRLNSQSRTDALSARQGWILLDEIDRVDELLDIHRKRKATENWDGHVQVDGVTIVADEDGIISAVGSGGDVRVIDDLTSTSTTDALSANKGRVVAELASTAETAVQNHLTAKASPQNLGHVKTDNVTIQADANGVISVAGYNNITGDLDLLSDTLSAHMQTMASKDDRGHVFIDNETIVVNANGEISAVIPPTTISVIDNLQSVSTTDALSARQGRELATGIDDVSNLLSRHVQTDNGTDSVKGHVQVDGVTILSNNGVISAAPPEWEPFIDDSTITVNPQGRLTAPLSTEYYHNGNRVSGVKIAMVTAVTTGTEGLWTADYSSLGLQQIFSIQATMQAGNFSAANAPLSTNVRSFTLTTATGTAFKATSAGLLTAMQQTRADAGTEIYLQIIGR